MSPVIWVILGVGAVLLVWLFASSARRHFIASLLRQAIYLIPRYFV